MHSCSFVVIPFQFSIVAVLVYGYIKTHRYITKHGIKIVKTKEAILEKNDEERPNESDETAASEGDED